MVFYRLIDLSLYVPFDGHNDVVGATLLCLSQPQVVDARDGLLKEAQCECLNLLCVDWFSRHDTLK